MSLENVEPRPAVGGAERGPFAGNMEPVDQGFAETEVDIRELAERGETPPHAKAYRVHIDCEVIRIDTSQPTGETLLGKVHKRPCAYELVAEFAHCENQIIEPGERVDLRQPGLKGFITAHKEIVTIFIQGEPYKIERGERTVAQILDEVGRAPDGYILLEEKNGSLMPVPPTVPVTICGCEVFHTQPQSGASS